MTSEGIRAAVRRCLTPVPRAAPSPPGRPLAAVLLLLSPGPRGPEVLLLERPRWLRQHPGQIALPGGGVKAADADPAAAALRETAEEVGLAAGAVELLGFLGYFPVAVSGWEVAAYVGWWSGREALRPDPGEVAALLRVPLEELLAALPAVSPDAPEFFCRRGSGRVRIWGATARILHRFLTTAADHGAPGA